MYNCDNYEALKLYFKNLYVGDREEAKESRWNKAETGRADEDEEGRFEAGEAARHFFPATGADGGRTGWKRGGFLDLHSNGK